MSPDPLDYLRHILDEAEYLMDRTQGLAKEDFIGELALFDEMMITYCLIYDETQ